MRDLAMIRVALGPVRFADAWASGHAMSVDDAVAYALTPEPADVAVIPAPTLTRRERDVVERIARGLSNREIAAELVISLLTVESHVRNILRKLGLDRRGQVAAWAGQRQRAASTPQDRSAPARDERERRTGLDHAG
jgi:non-specific serine/threonine protein kinase